MKVLRYPAFLRLILAYLVSQAGSKVHRVALLVLVYLLTENALWVSLTLGVQLLGTVVFSPLLSAWADTQDRKTLLVWSDLLRAPLVALIPLLGAKSLPFLLLLVFLIELLRDLHDPIQNAALPDLVPEEEVDEANGLVLLAERLSEVLFVGAAGALVALVGPVMNGAVLIGTMLGGALEGHIGAPKVFLLAGAMVSLAALYTLLTGGIPAPIDTPTAKARGILGSTRAAYDA